MNIAISVVLVLAILVVLVVIHELGHFVVARIAKVRVHEFGIGFPPRALILGKDKETVYTLNWLPIGGFVRLEGEEGESSDPRAFVNASTTKRLLILIAGVAMNFLLAWLIFATIAGVSDPVTTVKLGCVLPGSPAASVGLVGGTQTGTTSQGQAICDNTGDAILAIDGEHFPAFDDMNTGDAPLRYLRAHAGQLVTLTIQHADGTIEDRQVTLRVPQNNDGALGISSLELNREQQVTHDPVTAVKLGLARTVEASTLILRTLGDLVTNVDNLTNPPVSGPIGIVSAVDTVRTQLPPVFLFWLIGMLSANLAVVNLLPLPPLDGGRIFMTILQKVSGGRVTPQFERAFYLAGFIFLITFLIWVSYFDIARGVSWDPVTALDQQQAAIARERLETPTADDPRVEGEGHLSGRRETVTVDVGGIQIGSRHPIVVQSMTNTDTADPDATALQVAALAHAGSELVRVTVNNDAAAKAVPEIRRKLDDLGVGVPLIGDFHYNGHQLLIEYPEAARDLAKYRINPGNVGAKRHDENFQTIVRVAMEWDKPVRIGVNWGSLDQALLTSLMDANALAPKPRDSRDVMIDAMIESALRSAELAEETGLAHDRIVISAKVSGVRDLVDVYRLLAKRCDYPLHLGLTEAGMSMKGIVASTAGLSILLNEGIGDTIRVSLTPAPGGDRTEEVRVAQQVLQSLGLRSFMAQVSACPGCGRTTSTFFQEMAQRIQGYLREQVPVWSQKYPGVEEMRVAVMGCVVNGPGESKHADIGISLPGTFEEPVAPVFVDGALRTTLRGEGLVDEFIGILDDYVEKRYGSASAPADALAH